jgi:hypothetical protein
MSAVVVVRREGEKWRAGLYDIRRGVPRRLVADVRGSWALVQRFVEKGPTLYQEGGEELLVHFLRDNRCAVAWRPSPGIVHGLFSTE